MCAPPSRGGGPFCTHRHTCLYFLYTRTTKPNCHVYILQHAHGQISKGAFTWASEASDVYHLKTGGPIEFQFSDSVYYMFTDVVHALSSVAVNLDMCFGRVMFN